MDIVFLAWVAAILAFFFGSTYFLKRSGRAQTYYIISLVKTKRFIPLLDRFTKHRRFLNAFADIGLILGFGAIAVDFKWGRKKTRAARAGLFVSSALLLYFLLEFLAGFFGLFQAIFTSPFIKGFNVAFKLAFAVAGLGGMMLMMLAAYAVFILQSILLGKKVCPGIAPILPGIQIPKVPIVVPLHGWLSFVLILLMHEGMHGIIARKIGVKIKSAGVLLLGLLPIGAFVEPDEKELKRKSREEQLRVYSAGPASNLYASLLLPVVLLLLSLAIFMPFIYPWAYTIKTTSVQAVVITGVEEKIEFCGEQYENPAFGRLFPGMQLLKINDVNIVTASTASAVMSAVLLEGEGKPVTFEVLDEEGRKVTETIEPNELGIIRLELDERLNPSYEIPADYKAFSMVASLLGDFIFWFILLNFFIAIANFLPVEPFDGGRIVKILLLPYFGFLHMKSEETERFIGRLFLWIVAGLVAINILPFFL